MNETYQTKLFNFWPEIVNDPKEDWLELDCVFCEHLDESLHCSCPMNVHEYLCETRLNLLCEHNKLIKVGHFKNFLA